MRAAHGGTVLEMHFNHPEAKWIHDHSFGSNLTPPDYRDRIQSMADSLKQTIALFVERYDIDVLVPQNALAIPMHIPLGVALTDFIAETGITTLNHCHDFYWERDRFLSNGIPDILDRCFPPPTCLPCNTWSSTHWHRTRSRAERRAPSTLLPNIFDFEAAHLP